MFATVQVLVVLDVLFLLEFSDFVYCVLFDFCTVIFNICSRDFLWYKIDLIRLSCLSAGKLVFCQKTDMLFMFVLA